MKFQREYTSKTTYTDYDNDKKEFFGHDASYEETTDMEQFGDQTIYNKRVTFCTEDKKVWGCWVEILTRRTEPIFKVMSTHHIGDDVYTQTVQKIGEKVYEELEYFDYGDGFKTIEGSKYVRNVDTYLYGEC